MIWRHHKNKNCINLLPTCLVIRFDVDVFVPLSLPSPLLPCTWRQRIIIMEDVCESPCSRPNGCCERSPLFGVYFPISCHSKEIQSLTPRQAVDVWWPRSVFAMRLRLWHKTSMRDYLDHVFDSIDVLSLISFSSAKSLVVINRIPHRRLPIVVTSSTPSYRFIGFRLRATT